MELREPQNDHIATDWEGADDIERDLQNKIKSNMEQEPKVEKLPKEEIDNKLRGALRELHGIMDEGLIRVSTQSLDARIRSAQKVIGDALELLEKLG